jgi:PAS domain S-box-containing protein
VVAAHEVDMALSGDLPTADDQGQFPQDEGLYRLMVEAVREHAIFLLDPAGRVASWNAGAERIKGYRAEEILGRHYSCFYTPEAVAQGAPGRVLETAAALGRVEEEGWRVRKDGSRLLANIVLTALRDAGGTLRGFSKITRELTERKPADEALRSVVDNVLDGIITIDEQGTVQSFNATAEKIFGYRAGEVVGRNVNMLMPEPYHGEHDEYLNNYRATGQAKIIGIGREVVGRRSDGSTFPMDLAVSAFRVGDQRLFTGIVRDITDRKRLEHELRRRVDELAEADRRKDEFLAMLAHELRNPLAAINSAVQLTSLTGVRDQIEWCMDVINRQIKQLARLIDDLLDVSRITRGKIQLRTERIDVRAVLRSAVEAARALIEARRHDLVVIIEPGALMVEGDPLRLEQVVTNLLTNAAKYTDSGGRIDLSAGREGAEVVIRVRDTGIGISPEQISEMFELFAQGDRSLARSEGGLGIGLTLARSLAEMHGGSLTAKSEGRGKGSEFVVRLPTAPPAGGHAEARPAVGTAPRRTSRVLVIDDNVDMARGLAKLLKLLGHDVRVAHDGPSGLDAARDQRPEVILLDIGLPGMDGYHVAERLRREEFGKGVLLIAVTGYGQDEDRQRARAVGFDRYVTKPVDYPTLLALVSDSGGRPLNQTVPRPSAVEGNV